MDWDRLRVFKAVAQAGSLTSAAARLHISQSAISRNIGHLEDSLDVKLFHRHPRGLTLTESGEILLNSVEHIFQELSDVEMKIREQREKPSGQLNVTSSVGLGTTWLTDQMREFLDLYPDMDVNLLLCDHELDLSKREADVAIRLTKPQQLDLIMRKISSFTMRIYANKDYLKKYGEPKTLEALDQYQFIAFDNWQLTINEDLNWLQSLGLKDGGQRQARLQVNSMIAMYRAVRAGIGIGSLPSYMVRNPDELNLKLILPEYEGPKITAYFVYPEELRNAKKVGSLRDFLLSHSKTLS